MGSLIERLAGGIDFRDITVLLGLALLVVGLGLWSVPLALVVLGALILMMTVGPVVVNVWKVRKQ